MCVAFQKIELSRHKRLATRAHSAFPKKKGTSLSFTSLYSLGISHFEGHKSDFRASGTSMENDGHTLGEKID